MAANQFSLSISDPVYGEALTVTVTGIGDSKKDDNRDYWLRAECSQDGNVVYRQWGRPVDGSAELLLGPTRLWTGGSADGHVVLGYFGKRHRLRIVERVDFVVSG